MASYCSTFAIVLLPFEPISRLEEQLNVVLLWGYNRQPPITVYIHITFLL